MKKLTCGLITAGVLAVIFVLIAEGFLIVELVMRLTKDSRGTDEKSKEISEANGTGTELQQDLRDSKEVWGSTRLPSNLTPISYNVSLRPEMEKDERGEYRCWGSSSVLFACKKSTKYIIMHQTRIDFSHANVSLLLEGEAVKVSNITFHKPNQFIVLEMEVECEEEKTYHLHIENFTSVITPYNVFGLYFSEYKEENGTTRKVLSSQMQPTGARSVFPCFDEPAMKANFTFTLWYKADSNVTPLSNMPAKITASGQLIDGQLWNYTVFEETPPISTYLLVVVIGEYSGKTVKTKSGVQMTTYASKDAVNNGEVDIAVDIARNIFNFYETYFGLKYPLPKLDQVAVKRLAFGAMENWGLITYKDSIFLLNEKSSLGEKFRTTRIISHELVHQWFGNLVTLEWWSEVWLNEGFASYFSYVGESIVHPEWEPLGRFLLKEYYPAMDQDQTSSTHPIITNVSNPFEIWKIFDTISYKKGACMLRMIQGFLGEEAFISGLRTYLQELKYGTTNSKILVKYWEQEWNASQATVPLKDIIFSWLLQPGFPVVNVARNRVPNSSYQITQERFSPHFGSWNRTKRSQWHIPLTYRAISSNETKLVCMIADQETNISENGVIIVNVDARGYYRVNYDKETWNVIIQNLKNNNSQNISTENRAQLLSDCFTMVKSGRLNAITALDLSEYLIKETEYLPWAVFLKEVKYFEDMLAWTKRQDYLFKFIRRLIDPIYEKYGWSQKPDALHRLFGYLAVHYACRYGNKDCVNKSVTHYSNWMQRGGGDSGITRTFRSTVYCVAIRYGGHKEWNFAIKQLSRAIEQEEKDRLAFGMCCQSNPWILMQRIKDDFKLIAAYVSEQKLASSLTWSYVIGHPEMVAKLKFEVGPLLSQIAKRFSTRDERNLVIDALKSGIRFYDLDTMYATINSNIAWREANDDKLEKWLLQKLI